MLNRFLAVVLGLLTFVASAHAQNLVVNGDFEGGFSGWTTWQVSNGFWNGVWIQSNDCDIWVPTVCPYAGAISHAQKKGSGSGNAHGGLFQVIDVAPGQRYRVSGQWSGGVTGNAAGNATWWEVVVFDGVVDASIIDAGTRPQDTQVAKRTMDNLSLNGVFQFEWEAFGTTFVAQSSQVTLVLKAGSFSTFDAASYHDQIALVAVPVVPVPVDAPWMLVLAALGLAAAAWRTILARARR